jgi:Icc-related predicted phosphoesterase
MKVRITHISDTHGIHKNLYLNGGDILIHTGDVFDFKNNITEEEILDWFDNTPYEYKIIVQGNHDNFSCKNLPYNTYILNNNVLDLYGVKIYGTSAILPENRSQKQYNVNTENELKQILKPKRIDILATHGSPKGILDMKLGKSIGSFSLLSYVNMAKPKLHLFGHTHQSIGTFNDGNTTFINNSIVKFIRTMQIQSNPLDIIYGHTH